MMHRESILYTLLRWTVVLLLLLVPAAQLRADSKKALKLLEKGDFEKLIPQLDKSLRKDTVNAGARYVYSLLFHRPEYPGYHLDSAYRHALRALSDYGLEDDKEKSRLAKIGIDEPALEARKSAVERSAFQRARKLHTIGIYNHFINYYAGAAEADSAVLLRDAIAFDQARALDTYEGYAAFMQTYPDAVQVEEARTRYEALLYREKTREGGLASQERFIVEFPDSPYRPEAERNIFELITAGNRPADYLRFLSRHRGSSQEPRAIARLYHRVKEDLPALDFFRQQPTLPLTDSLRNIAQAEPGHLVPVYEMGLYGFLDSAGRQVIGYRFSDVEPDYLCGRVTSDVLVVRADDKPVLANRLGETVCPNPWDDLGDLGSGLLQVWQDNRVGVVFKTGEKVLDIRYEGVELIARAYLKAAERGKWGLFTVTGRPVLPVEYDDIYAEDDFILIEKGGLLAVQTVESLSAVPDQGPVALSFRYDDYELIGDGFIQLFRDDLEALVDSRLQERVALDRHRIDPLYEGWVLRDDRGVQLLDRGGRPLTEQRYEQLLRNRNAAALRSGGKWAFYRRGTDPPLVFAYDSAGFLSDDIALLRDGPNTYAVFANDSLVNLSGAAEVRLLRPTGADDSVQYLLTTTARGTSTLYDRHGRRVLSGKFDQVEALGAEYIVVEVRGKKGLYHAGGKELLKARYDAIGNYENGSVSTLLQGRFGMYIYNQSLLLDAKYQRAIRPYGNQYFIGYKGNQMAFIGRDNKELSAWIFDEVLYWNDTAALVKTADGWGIYDIGSRGWHLEGIGDYRSLRDDSAEKVLLVIVNGKAGVLSNRRGLIIKPTLDDVQNLGTPGQPLYFGEKYIPEAEFYVVIYYDGDGRTLRRQVFDRDEYQRIVCE